MRIAKKVVRNLLVLRCHYSAMGTRYQRKLARKTYKSSDVLIRHRGMAGYSELCNQMYNIISRDNHCLYSA
jgi:hypothetical protein